MLRNKTRTQCVIYTNTSIYNYTTWSNNEQNLLFGSGQTRVRVSRQRRTTDYLSKLTTRTEIASETFRKLPVRLRAQFRLQRVGTWNAHYWNFGNRIRIPNLLITLCKRNNEFSRYYLRYNFTHWNTDKGTGQLSDLTRSSSYTDDRIAIHPSSTLRTILVTKTKIAPGEQICVNNVTLKFTI